MVKVDISFGEYNKEKMKNQKAQAMVAMFTYMMIVSLIAVYITVYAKNFHGSVVRGINHTKGLYAAEAGAIRALDILEWGRRNDFVNLYVGNYAGTWGPWKMPNLTLVPAGLTNRIDFDVTEEVTYLGNGVYRVRSRVTNW